MSWFCLKPMQRCANLLPCCSSLSRILDRCGTLSHRALIRLHSRQFFAGLYEWGWGRWKRTQQKCGRWVATRSSSRAGTSCIEQSRSAERRTSTSSERSGTGTGGTAEAATRQVRRSSFVLVLNSWRCHLPEMHSRQMQRGMPQRSRFPHNHPLERIITTILNCCFSSTYASCLTLTCTSIKHRWIFMN